MKDNYLMGIEKGDDNSLYNLACYYYDVEQNYDLMKKYYLMAIKKGNNIAMIDLSYYYYYRAV